MNKSTVSEHYQTQLDQLAEHLMADRRVALASLVVPAQVAFSEVVIV